MKKNIIIILGLSILNSCNLFEERRLSGTAAEYNGKTITLKQLQLLTTGLTPEDSTRVAEQYIHQWAIDLIEYDIAKDQTNKTIESLVEDYRRSLYLHEYEERLVAQYMPRIIEDSVIQSFYDMHRNHFILPETIIQGILLVVPHDAPNIDELRKKIQHPDVEENIEWLEKFAYQYAVGYELFLDDWKNTNAVIVHIPLGVNELNKQLRTKRQIEVQDSVNTFILQVTDMHPEGAQMPLAYARKEIENILLHERQIEFLQREREALYNQAIKEGKLKLYEK